MQQSNRLVLLISAMLIGALSLPAQIRMPKIGGGDKEKKEAERQEKERRSDEKNTARYEKLKRFSLDKFASDPDFRDEVEEAFEELMRDHSQRAYDKNIHRDSYIKVVHEDSWRVHAHLYDNLLVQDHVNRLGQRLVPKDSEKAFAFKVIPDPTPIAETLSTGTIYVSTGLIASLETEAQLAYVLAHEMSHVHLDHWRERVMMEQGQEAYAEAQQKKAKRWALIGTVAGGALGGAIGQSAQSALSGAALGAVGGIIAGSLINRPLIVNWDRVQEDAADEMAFKALLESSFDVREIPKLYLAMETMSTRDRRVGLGFIGDRRRVKQRREKADELIQNAYKAEIELQLKKGFQVASAEHRNLMAELKRDNGIMAYYRDMFDMARTNLQEAIAIRDNDPAAHYFYGKVMKLTGKTDEDLRLAKESFYKATQADKHQQNYGSHLHLALMLARERQFDRKMVAQELDTYVKTFTERRAFMGVVNAFPPNLDSIYEYMSMYGDPGWQPAVPDLKRLEQYQVLRTVAESARSEAPARDAVEASPAARQTNEEIPPAARPATVVQGVAGAAAAGSALTGGSRAGTAAGAAAGILATQPGRAKPAAAGKK